MNTAERLFWKALDEAIKDRKHIIIDRTNMSVKARKRFFNVLNDLDARDEYEVNAYVFGLRLPPIEWLKRLGDRPGKTIPGHVLISFAKNFEYPTREERL